MRCPRRSPWGNWDRRCGFRCNFQEGVYSGLWRSMDSVPLHDGWHLEAGFTSVSLLAVATEVLVRARARRLSRSA